MFVSAADIQSNAETQCKETVAKDRLLSGWYSWNPYQFNKVVAGTDYLTGLDITVVKKLADKLGVTVEYALTGWGKHQKDLNEGERDMAVGATYTQERAEYVYFSTPYRFEENSLFTLVNSSKNLDFSSISDLLSQIRSTNYKLGVTKEFIYADSQINLFISDQTNQDIIKEYSDDVEALGGLLKGEIDGFITDRVVGSSAILNHKATALVKEVQLYIKSPIHFIFSKKTVPLDLVDKFNQGIKEFIKSTEYNDIIKAYLYPVILVQTVNSQWFYILGIIGCFSFAVSAVAIVARENGTLFVTCLMAIIPSIGIGIVRDILINRDEIGLFLTPSYIYYSILVVFIGFAFIRLLECYNKNFYEDEVMIKFWDSVLVIGDARRCCMAVEKGR
ncbi:MAG: transporter substrate-binding domain-containing protein [Rickettsiaceae bacterium]|nr:transporter substrate-binding domain-containing protein [Rickettsiaceae bacterium]